jgi:transposase
MKLKSNQPKASAEQVVKDIRRATRRHYSTEDKIQLACPEVGAGRALGASCRPNLWHLQKSFHCG